MESIEVFNFLETRSNYINASTNEGMYSKMVSARTAFMQIAYQEVLLCQ